MDKVYKMPFSSNSGCPFYFLFRKYPKLRYLQLMIQNKGAWTRAYKAEPINQNAFKFMKC